MSELRKLLFPFSQVYNGITKTRNMLYDSGLLTSNAFDIPIISVGNLRVGGTGKTPMVAYLIALLQKKYHVAVLSRGYKRKTKGFVLADAKATAETLGDESYQLHRRYPKILVAVDANRSRGIQDLLKLQPRPDLILMDDAFQHRKVKTGLQILLTPFDDLYVDDALMPMGNLRESETGAKRAQILVVTKCPEELTEQQEFEIAKRLKPDLKQTVFFSSIQYAPQVVGKNEQIEVAALTDYGILLVTGIANPKPLLDFLNAKHIDYQHLEFPDHHRFSTKDLAHINREFHQIKENKKLILTTEKDYVRIFANFADLYYLGIESKFIHHQSDFDKLIINYVEQSTRNS